MTANESATGTSPSPSVEVACPSQSRRNCRSRSAPNASIQATPGLYVRVYSGPAPPSGGVSRPPFAVIAPHCTQFDGVTSTLPSLAS